MATVSFESVSKNYGEVVAVAELDLVCRDGEMLALLGPSGCGKSTTLKMVAGIETPSRGAIRFDERAVTDLLPGERNIAMVFEDYALYPHLTAYENIAFPLKVRGYAKREIKAKVAEAIELLGLGDLTHSRVAKLSGGAQQRIAIGRALVREPDLILFDEPLSHLDADQKVLLRTQIKRLQQTQGVTSILVTHDQTEAIAMCDRIAVMNHGILQQVGEPQELYDQPANLFVANFIGEPPMNQLSVDARIEDGRLMMAGSDFQLEFAGDLADQMATLGGSRQLVLGIRPEHLNVHRSNEAIGPAIQAQVMAREPRGDSDTLLLVTGSDHSFTNPVRLQAEIPAELDIMPGESVFLTMPESHVIPFDAQSGINLRKVANGA